jgi:nicotinamide mononucleotide transporter
VMRELFPRGWLAVLIAVIIGSLIYVQFLTLFNVHYSQWDSVTLVISIVGQILTTFRFVEQWVTWLCLDIFNVIWWFLVLYPVNGDLTIAVMWAFKLVNVFYGWYTWNKLGKAQTKLVSGPYCAYEPQFTRHY